MRSATAMLDSGVQLAYQVARSKWKRQRFISLFLACSRSPAVLSVTSKAGSTASIIAGAITGVLLLVAAFLLPEHRVAGLATALIISVLLAGQFVPKFFRTGRIMPAGMMSVLSVIGIIAAIVAWVRK